MSLMARVSLMWLCELSVYLNRLEREGSVILAASLVSFKWLGRAMAATLFSSVHLWLCCSSFYLSLTVITYTIFAHTQSTLQLNLCCVNWKNPVFKYSKNGLKDPVYVITAFMVLWQWWFHTSVSHCLETELLWIRPCMLSLPPEYRTVRKQSNGKEPCILIPPHSSSILVMPQVSYPASPVIKILD